MKFILLLSLAATLFYGCSENGFKPEPTGELATLSLTLSGSNLTRVSSDIGTNLHNVNRILVLPFQQTNAALPDNDARKYIPDWGFARQYDIDAFPADSIELKLPESFTYQIVIIGYNRNDYDHQNPTASTNRVVLTDQPASVTLANFRLSPKSPNNVPEFFTCLCSATSGGSNIGSVFTPSRQNQISLSGNLKRIVSGLGVYLEEIPSYVRSITLKAGKMVKAIQINDTLASSVQTNGDNESRIIQALTPANQQVKFNEFLLPTLNTNKTLYYLDVDYGTGIKTYTINVPDSDISVSNQIILLPNDVVIIKGKFSDTHIGFTINRNINLDDDQWDGLQ